MPLPLFMRNQIASIFTRRTLRALFIGGLLFASGASVLSSGCSTADNLFDCQAVCTRYRDCFSSSYDVAACRNRCRSNSEADPSVQQKADQCQACIDDKSCAAATFSCTTECAAIVP
jgi:hypothetical protein